MNQEKIGRIIKNIRIQNKLTQQELGDKLGVTSQAVSKWENGRGIPDIDTIHNISNMFNIDLNDLFEVKKKSRMKTLYAFLGSFILIVGIVVCVLLFKNSNFKFVTLSSKNSNFDITGVAAYSKDKKSIFISNIDYLNDEKDEKNYKVVECTLYETLNEKENKISKCGDINQDKNNPTKLSNLLKNVEFNVGDYSSMCKHFNKHNLYLLINAKDENDKVVSYKVPLELNENCN